MKTLKVDVAIIGSGTAGLAARRVASRAGASTVMIEDGPYGTTCARVGCMPSKLLIAAADAAYTAAHAAPFGVHIDGVRVDGREVMERVRRERDRFVDFVLRDVERIPEEEKLRGRARFLSDTVLQVDDHTQVQARSVIIATGTRPNIPPQYQPLADRAIVNDDVFNWEELPESVAVVGAGVIGLELGQALSRLGVRTRILQRSKHLGGLRDPEVFESAVAAFQQELDLCLEAAILGVRRVGNEAEIRYQVPGTPEVTERFDYVLLAAGRVPNLDDMGLENTSIALDDRGRPLFDAATLQIGDTPIFIAGDVNGVLPLLHEAADDGRIAGANAAGYPANVTPGSRRAPLSIVFSDPQLAAVGLRFNELPEDVAIGEVDFSNQGRSRIMLKNRGKLRVYAERGSGLFLGAEMAGPAMEHISHLLAWAAQQKLTVDQMLAMPFYHPVVEEGVRTALQNLAKALAN
ncbi:dihydrolipoyl dehydrogenase [Achromobacter sp. F4_2707]|uniref:dihydrolipoyl dehydrogenase n=1 Tax=Achromobacter sp. F4_2707 TaxID=3114286 RepID=UPI0039C5FBC3